MAKSIPALVEPVMLRWARETIDLPAIAASRKLGLPDDRVATWEAGEQRPTIAQLRKAAQLYRRSLGVFFLPNPPEGFDTLRDLRRHEGAVVAAWSPALHADYRRAHVQREHLLALADIDDLEPSSAWRMAPLPDVDGDIAAAARERLASIAPLPLPSGSATVYEHVNYWVAALEAAGILVLATAGGRVETTEMRGLSLFFDQAPVIMVNGADAPRGRLFTLLHEYAHLLLHTGGLCDLITDTAATTPDRALEARCNAIAADILMPAPAVLARPEVIGRRHTPTSWNYDALAAAAAPFGVSAEAFLRRLLTLGRVTPAFYQAKRGEFQRRYEEEDGRAKPKGGDWYRNTVRDLGKGYVRLVTDAHRRRVIDSLTAADYLNAKVGQISGLAAKAALREGV